MAGRSRASTARKTALALQNYSDRRFFELSARQRFLARIVEPDVFSCCCWLVCSGCTRNSRIPGWLPRAWWAVSACVLALYAMHFLPVNFAGVLLILLALALFVLEAKFTSHGVLAARRHCVDAVGRDVSDSLAADAGGVSFGVALAATLPFALLTVFLMRLVLRSRTWKIGHRKGRTAWRRGNCHHRAWPRRRRRHDSRPRRIVARASPKPIPVGASSAGAAGRGLKLDVEPVEAPATARQVECVASRGGQTCYQVWLDWVRSIIGFCF